jgi:MYXO-CTERM domain-containing protein
MASMISSAVRYSFVSLAAMAVLAAPTALAGPSWDRDLQEDALETAVSAQLLTHPLGSVTTVFGRLSGYGLVGADFVDMYRIRVQTPSLLSISTGGGSLGGEADFNTQLFIFRQKGGNGNNQRAVSWLANDDAGPGNSGSRLSDNSELYDDQVYLSPGDYYIAITGVGMRALGSDGLSLWDSLGDPGDSVVSAMETLGSWAGEGETGQYAIRIQSGNASSVPTPGGLAVLALGALTARRRLR